MSHVEHQPHLTRAQATERELEEIHEVMLELLETVLRCEELLEGLLDTQR